MQDIIANSQECYKNYLMFVKYIEDENWDISTKCKFYLLKKTMLELSLLMNTF